jgi:hypothetical protein
MNLRSFYFYVQSEKKKKSSRRWWNGKKEKNLINKNQAWESIQQKYKANQNTNTHNLKKNKQTIIKNQVKLHHHVCSLFHFMKEVQLYSNEYETTLILYMFGIISDAPQHLHFEIWKINKNHVHIGRTVLLLFNFCGCNFAPLCQEKR